MFMRSNFLSGIGFVVNSLYHIFEATSLFLLVHIILTHTIEYFDNKKRLSLYDLILKNEFVKLCSIKTFVFKKFFWKIPEIHLIFNHSKNRGGI